LHKNVKTIVILNFKWDKVDGKWTAVNVLTGQGMVNFYKYLNYLNLRA